MRAECLWMAGVWIGVALAPAWADPRTSASPPWTISADVLGYLVPHDRDFAQPTVSADRNALHLEARYNYEDLDTGSLWLGYNLHAGEHIRFEFTPMVAGVFGATDGVAPGYRVALGTKWFGLSSEGEYVFDVNGPEGDFFYTWSELVFEFWRPFYFGGVLQRTRAYQSEFDLQRGPLVGLEIGQWDFTTYIFNPDIDPTVVLGIATQFD